jgi:hypothetical protein
MFKIAPQLRKYSEAELATLIKSGRAYVDSKNGIDYILPLISGGVDGSADFETGVNGANISTGDVGSATAFASVANSGTASPPVYDNAHVKYGSLACKFVGGGLTESSHIELPFTTVTSGSVYARFYAYFSPIQPVGNLFVAFLNGGGFFRQDSTDNWWAYINGEAGGAFTLTYSQWIRVEMQTGVGAGAQSCTVKIWNNPDSSGAADQTSTATDIAPSSVSSLFLGLNPTEAGGGRPAGTVYWVDQVIAGSTSGFYGPFSGGGGGGGVGDITVPRRDPGLLRRLRR